MPQRGSHVFGSAEFSSRSSKAINISTTSSNSGI
jgi:hypothetical protein